MTSTFEFLFGRSWVVSLRIIAVGVFLSISIGLIGRLIPLGAIVVYRSEIAGVLASMAFLSGAGAIAYFNSGYVVILLIQVLLLLGLFTSGGVAVFPGSSMVEQFQLKIQFAIVIGLLLSTIGYAVGGAVRSIRS
ncbi:hypothetical protein [Halocatena marina]|uniref:ABC transporter permease n=2 Tax=Halocatena marina TaxID=2934937 RepID=A0ABD5YW90_9EURY|nr:hypothetical protein [Halocatena marina]